MQGANFIGRLSKPLARIRYGLTAETGSANRFLNLTFSGMVIIVSDEKYRTN